MTGKEISDCKNIALSDAGLLLTFDPADLLPTIFFRGTFKFSKLQF